MGNEQRAGTHMLIFTGTPCKFPSMRSQPEYTAARFRYMMNCNKSAKVEETTKLFQRKSGDQNETLNLMNTSQLSPPQPKKICQNLPAQIFSTKAPRWAFGFGNHSLARPYCPDLALVVLVRYLEDHPT